MTDAAIAPRRPWAYAIFLVVFGAAGWWAAFQLTLDKFLVLEKGKNAVLNCNISPFVQCGTNLQSWQGSAFGFPNPILGLGGFAAVIAVGVTLLAGARLARWYWWLFNLGVAGALVFTIWLIVQSAFVLGTLCPWCGLVYLVMFPLFWVVTLRNAATGEFGSRLTRIGGILLPYAAPIAIVCLIAVGLIFQLRLDVLHHLAA
ncbi:vitamin K epoxide reductase family protein [Pseudolysinimonas sp.]|uniref:vitamin K epoxide reductase family protein n=1 Tax=Pseudolysinimonas sp. TaxID=2680009 RepID=UPI003F817853